MGSNVDNSEKIFVELDKLYTKVQSEARKQNISEIDFAGIISNSVLTGMNINNCKTFDPRVRIFKQFFRENERLLVLTVDKKSDLLIEQKTVYLEKIKQALSKNFKEVQGYGEKLMQKYIKLYRTLLQTTFGGS